MSTCTNESVSTSENEKYTIRKTSRLMSEEVELVSLLKSARVGRIAVIADGEPYVVPMNYAYIPGDPAANIPARILVHGADRGRFLIAIGANPRVCFEVDEHITTLPDPVLCEYDTAYISVLCFGHARLLQPVKERTEAMRAISLKYAPPEEVARLRESTVEKYRSSLGAQTGVVEIIVERMTGKRQSLPTHAPPEQESPDGKPEAALASIGNVPPEYEHHDRIVTPGKELLLPAMRLKWYDVRRPQAVVPRRLVQQARRTITRDVQAGAIRADYGLGTVILHLCDTVAFLIAGTWANCNELRFTVYRHNLAAGGEFRRTEPQVDGQALCVWELAPVWHEREAWRRYLYSPRDDRAKKAYLSDQLSGIV
ncbi:MAG: pyridoxamine 5'-phosphate oxidase family protein [Chloroflexota bacterium]|nr:pyridoxamine 5'-phosphate oxidase family protein [Chloroflexota bacterium]